VDDGTISGKMAKTVFEEMCASGKDSSAIIKKKGLTQISDTGELTEAVRAVLDDNPEEVKRYLGGKTALIGFFVGQVMKRTKGKANPNVVNEILTEELKRRGSD
jgi:aspartyl-tRNA(Asn)/glutamyl-tRNA(Gln) amidotransferase subunit B